MPKLLTRDHPSVALCGGGSQQACEQKPLGVLVQCPEGLCWESDSQPFPCGWRTRQNGRSFSLGRTSKRHSGSFQFKRLQVLFSIPTGFVSTWHPQCPRTGCFSAFSWTWGPSSRTCAYLSRPQTFSTFQPKVRTGGEAAASDQDTQV